MTSSNTPSSMTVWPKRTFNMNENHTTSIGKSITELVNRIRCKCIDHDVLIRKATSLSPAEFNVVCSLDHGEVISGTDFAKKIGLSISRSSRIIDKMSKDDYLIVQRNDNDRRSITIQLTSKSESLKNEIEESHRECNERIFSALGEDEFETITNSLERLLSVL